MIKKYVSPLLVMALVFSFSAAQAQFEGQIVFDSYEVTEDGSREKDDEFTMYITGDRILLEGKRDYDLMGSIETEGILVRHDFKDFVFLNGEEAALKISKSDITSMMNMFGKSSSKKSASDIDADVSYEKTGEERVIKGHKSEKFIFTDKENPEQRTVVWMTPELDINWGMLAEPWGDSDLDMLGDDLNLDLVFKDGYFPMLIENYESNKLKGVAEVRQISTSNVARAMVEIPNGVKVLSFQDYLFSKMSGQ